MNKKVFHTLELDKILAQLTEQARTARGQELCRRLSPLTDLAEIERLQQETEDALSRIFAHGLPNLSDVSDVRIYEKRLGIGSALSSRELLSVGSLLEVARRLDSYGEQCRGKDGGRSAMPVTAASADAPGSDAADDASVPAGDSLEPLFASISPLTSLAREINRCIIAEDEYADDATPGLLSVRRQMVTVSEKIRSYMNSMLTNPNVRDYLQDSVITTRGGRYVVPVRAEHKGQVPGMVHDQSSSGATLFIEPMAVVTMNNQLRELELQEKQEIEKLLAALSAEVYEHAAELSADYTAIVSLDFIFARGQLARLQNATRPRWNDRGIIRLRGARHPLLDKHKVVPIDLVLGDEYQLLIVTGPNTGGKTVSLKTCGLLTLMGQCGLHIPALDRSELSVFHNVYADIGDEQSIEQSLSTFSSHMTNIVRILDGVRDCRLAGHRTLCLFDELCAGTDPTEGAALAISLLERLHGDGVCTMATTHYSELKVYALTTPGVENACCEFSLETLAPTYRLLIGIPGKSNAFAISARLGLPKEIIDDARGRVDEGDAALEDVLADLTQKHVAADAALAESEQKLKEARSKEQTLTAQQTKLDEQRARILEEAHLEAARILAEAKDVADETIRNFRKYGAGADMSKMEQDRQKLGQKLSDARGKTHQKQSFASQIAPSAKPEELHIGDKVRILSMNTNGIVHTLPDKNGILEVQMGILRSRVSAKDVVLAQDNDTVSLDGKAIAGTGKRNIYAASRKGEVETKTLNKSASISTEIQLLGMTSDEALFVLGKYLDDAYLSHLPSVRIVHGKGNGILRKAVHAYLRKQPHVAKFDLAAYGEGDSGVTVVTFK